MTLLHMEKKGYLSEQFWEAEDPQINEVYRDTFVSLIDHLKVYEQDQLMQLQITGVAPPIQEYWGLIIKVRRWLFDCRLQYRVPIAQALERLGYQVGYDKRTRVLTVLTTGGCKFSLQCG